MTRTKDKDYYSSFSSRTLSNKSENKTNIANKKNMSSDDLFFKVIQFTNFFICYYDIKMLREKIKETNVSSSNKCQVYNTMPLCHILNLSARETLWKMAPRKVNDLSTKKIVYHFQVVCVISELKKKIHSESKLIGVCHANFMKNARKYEKNNETRQYPCHCSYPFI